MYKALPVDGGWSIFWLETPDAEPRLMPRLTDDPEERYKPYPQRQAAYRRCKRLNDAQKIIDENMAQNGGAIIL